MEDGNTWLLENREKTLASFVHREFLLAAAKSFLLKNDPVNLGYRRIREKIPEMEFCITLGHLLPKSSYLNLVRQFTEDEKNQDHLIRSLVTSPVYKEFISELLYNSFRDFLLEENFFTQKVPVAGKLFRVGQNVASNTISMFSATSKKVETAIKKTIEKNLGVTEQYTYSILKRIINPKTLQNGMNFLYETVKDQEIRISHEMLPEKDADFNALLLEIIGGMIDGFLKQAGDRKIKDFFETELPDKPPAGT